MTYPAETRQAAVELAAETNDSIAAREFGVARRTIIRWRQEAEVQSGYTPTRAAGHGMPVMYRHYGCRCDECRAAWSVEMRRQNQARKAKREAS